MRDMFVVTQIDNRQELNEMKSILEIYVVNNRIRELAKFA
jgi:hypothetical protein